MLGGLEEGSHFLLESHFLQEVAFELDLRAAGVQTQEDRENWGLHLEDPGYPRLAG